MCLNQRNNPPASFLFRSAVAFAKVFTCLCLFLFVTASFATGKTNEETAAAAIDKNMLVTLSVSAPLSALYTADITQLHFASEAEATNFFNGYRDNLVAFTVDFPNKKLTIKLYQQYAPASWGLLEWNNHFKRKSQLYLDSKKQ